VEKLIFRKTEDRPFCPHFSQNGAGFGCNRRCVVKLEITAKVLGHGGLHRATFLKMFCLLLRLLGFCAQTCFFACGVF